MSIGHLIIFSLLLFNVPTNCQGYYRKVKRTRHEPNGDVMRVTHVTQPGSRTEDLGVGASRLYILLSHSDYSENGYYKWL